ncbi:dolichyl-phosphate-mannose-protein mannosyltransferase [Scheffersomyces amazonensis]|uniref:dolichyl-phosphate-mannose-protein mannosyltransferase n=1 Tax=Scheffersomyces amazonensis TaxID=1078765 RepID=UPI00315DDE08
MIEKPPSLPPGYKQGKWRSYLSTQISPQLLQQTLITSTDRFFIILLTCLGFIIRLAKLWLPARIVFDEVHIGTFLRFYFRGEFFIDVHPPLMKLIYFWIALLFDWNGNMEFSKIGQLYHADPDHEFPYVMLRLFSASCGILTVLLTYLILRYSACRSSVAFFGAGLVLIENSLITHSRLILLDSPFLLCIALVVFGMKRLQLQSNPFSIKGIKFLVVIGWALGLLTSIKLVGLFTIAWCGILTIQQIWRQLGDLDIKVSTWFGQIFARLLCLVVLPITIYLSIFMVHFETLPFSGEGSGIMSPIFKSGLGDYEYLTNQPIDVSYGSTVTLKHLGTEAYLHSHNFTYWSGTGEQQVSLYEFMPDDNNEWILETRNKNREGQLQKKFRPIKDGDTIRLFHKSTGKYLHVNNEVRPPMSDHDYTKEVSCNSNREELLGNINYEFKVRIVSKTYYSDNELPLRKLQATRSIFQLIHADSKCILMSHPVRLPDWGFGQFEVLCVDEPTIPNTLWYIEENHHPLIDDDKNYARVKFPQYNFFRKLWELHKTMFRINSSFTTHHRYSSKPETWPFVLRGINYFSNEGMTKYINEDPSHIYLLGNGAIYYTANLIILITFIKLSFYMFKHLNPFTIPYESLSISSYYQNSFEYLLGWAFHYIPFFYMNRELFLHHYLPALFFSILLTAQFIEYQLSKRRQWGIFLIIIISISALYCFWSFMPIIYGLNWTKSQCNHAKWLSSWDIDCMTY